MSIQTWAKPTVGTGGHFFEVAQGSATGGDRAHTMFSVSKPDRLSGGQLETLGDAANAIAAIRANLSLNITELAQILGVQRPTIYSWIEGGTPRRQSQAVLMYLLHASKRWKAISDSFPLGKRLHQASQGGFSIYQALRDHRWDHVMDLISWISAEVSQEQRQSKMSVRDLARKHGLVPSAGEQRAQIDSSTGRRFGEE